MSDTNTNSTSTLISDNKLLQIINSVIKSASTEDMYKLSIDNNTLYRKNLTDKYNDFAISYPALFNTITENPKKFDINRLKQMLSMRKQVQNNNLSYEEASTQIGQQYYDEFAKPIVDKLNK